MPAIRQHELGGPDALRYEQVPDPEAGDGQVRIHVEAIGVHLVDTWIVLDGVGGDESLRAYGLLADGGTLVNYTGADPESYVHPRRTMSSPLGPDWMQSRPGGLRGAEEEALAAAVDGSRTPVVGSRFALSDAAAAHRALEARRTVGKVVLVPDAPL